MHMDTDTCMRHMHTGGHTDSSHMGSSLTGLDDDDEDDDDGDDMTTTTTTMTTDDTHDDRRHTSLHDIDDINPPRNGPQGAK